MKTKKLFVVGTGTDIGKTYVTGLIAKKMRKNNIDVAYYKAAMSGNVRDDNEKLIAGDALFVKTMAGLRDSLDGMCPYVYETAVSPHLASRIEGRPVLLDRVLEGYERMAKTHDYVIMEGSGGILCPIDYDNSRLWLEDIIKMLGMDTVLVADAGLGTINSVGLTCYYMKSKGINVRGIIFNNYVDGDIMQEDNVKMCEELTGVKVIAKVHRGDTNIDIHIDKLLELFR